VIDMVQLREWMEAFWAVELVRAGVRAAAIVIGGVLLTRFVNRRMAAWSMHAQHRLLLRRAASALILLIVLAWALDVMGVRLGVVLGAAGVLTVAVGFAAQTSVSNLISGLFLMGERPFRVGDVITVAGTTGEVLSIDLLSIKLCTFDNLLVRIPNETMLKANVTNLTRFAIRRYDLKISVAYKEDLDRVRRVLLEVAEKEPVCLKNPKPVFIFQGFGESSMDVQFSVWAKRESFLELRNGIAIAVKRSFDAHGIEIPFPQRTLHAGAGVTLAVEPAPEREQEE
jgi:small-conductance mechanosensitive channel